MRTIEPLRTDDDLQRALRVRMVAEQIARRGVQDPAVLRAMEAVPRHLFVPPSERKLAYLDRALAIGEGQTISQPYMVAVMTEALEPTAEARVLEIGTGSGYQAAVLASIVREVITIERQPRLAAQARSLLAELGFRNVRVIGGDGSEGFAEAAPFDGILVTAGAPSVPRPLVHQLADGGRLVIPVGERMVQDLVIVRRVGEELRRTTGESCVFVPLLGRHGWSDETLS